MYNILVVDDDMQMLELIGQLLRREGYGVQAAYSAEQALDIIENDTDSEVPDLFMIDAVLPRLDGLALCRQLRKHPRTQSQPIIVITGQDSHIDVADALAAGSDDFILKPSPYVS
jgi:DNA-binding response OmpR family regulator